MDIQKIKAMVARQMDLILQAQKAKENRASARMIIKSEIAAKPR